MGYKNGFSKRLQKKVKDAEIERRIAEYKKQLEEKKNVKTNN